MKQEQIEKTLKSSPDLILLEKQEDGNWKGWMHKFGSLVVVREVGPETVLQKLLTHD
jgi:hypothetical protein